MLRTPLRDMSVEVEELPISTTAPPRAARGTGGSSAWTAAARLFAGIATTVVAGYEVPGLAGDGIALVARTGSRTDPF